jgi:hypothetical protein
LPARAIRDTDVSVQAGTPKNGTNTESRKPKSISAASITGRPSRNARNHLRAEAAALALGHRVEQQVRHRRIERGDRMARRIHHAARLDADEMEADKNGRLRRDLREIDRTIHFDEARERLRVAEPLRPTLDVAADHVAKVRARQTFARFVAHVREAQLQIGVHDAPARARNPIQQRADAGADSRDHPIGQEGEHAQQARRQTDENSTFHKAGTRWMLDDEHTGRGNLGVANDRRDMRARQTGSRAAL